MTILILTLIACSPGDLLELLFGGMHGPDTREVE